jgi:hypothetical protein
MKAKFEAWRSASHVIAFTLAVMSLPVAPQAQQPPRAAADQPLIAIQDGMLTFRGKNQPLRRILEQIEGKARLRIVLAPGVGNEQVSVEFQRFPLDEGLRQILKNYDTFFLYGVGQGNKEPAALSAVWVYPAGGARGLKPLSPDAWASTQEVEQMLLNSDPEIRARAVAEVIKRKGRQSGDVVRDALKDDSDMVRLAALRMASLSGVELTQQTLVDLAVNDKSAIVRFLALEDLPADPSLQWVAERALQDPNPNVSQKAREILQQLTPASAPPDRSPKHR